MESGNHEALGLEALGPQGNGQYFQVESIGFAGPQKIRTEPWQSCEHQENMAERWSRQLAAKWLHRESQAQGTSMQNH